MTALLLALAISLDSVGEVSLNCKKADGWNFQLTSERPDSDVEVVTVKMTRDSAAVPPEFSLSWFVPQTDIHHVWSSESTHYGIPWNEPMLSELTSSMPLYAFLDVHDRNRLAVACSESCRKVVFRSPISETKMGFGCSFAFFTVHEAPILAYEVSVRFDRRNVFYSDALGAGADWMCRAAGIEPLSAPANAYDALYSTWYDFHQDVSAEVVERECRLAANLGLKTVIVDDGWQIDLPLGNRPWDGYRFCGDWKPGRHFPDMAAHVKRVHEMGLKYMLWYSVPFVGKDSVNFVRFRDKCLPVECAGGHVLDPRFSEVREFIAGIYEKALREWDVDGFKLDFIGRFTLKEGVVDPAIAENYAGRDIKSIPLAVDALLMETLRRLKALKPSVLIEFRQPYVGPAIRRYGNMLRATDCPLSMVENRTRIARLRLTSGRTAVHSDMLEWRADETPESAARCILNAIFGVVQYSVRLDALPLDHRRMMEHWVRFADAHKEALVRGSFRPHYPAANYPLLEGESADERIFGVYQENLIVDVGKDDREIYVLNGTFAKSLTLDLPLAPERLEVFDTYGCRVGNPACHSGLCRIAVPPAGFVRLRWRLETSAKPIRFMTFNIYGAGYGGFGAEEREERIVSVIQRSAADILSLQEVNGGWWRSKLFESLAGDFEVVRGDEDAALVRAGADLSQRRDDWVNHEPLLYRKSRFRLLDSGLDFYHFSLQHEKSLTWAVLEDRHDGRRLIAFATHFWWKKGAEADAIRELNARHVLVRVSRIRQKWGDLPVLGGGDFNCESDALAMKVFADNGYADAGETAPNRSKVPSEHGDLVRDEQGRCRGRVGVKGSPGHAMLDHVVYTQTAFRPLRHDVVIDEDAIHISDHSPVWADIVLKERAGERLKTDK